MTAASAAVPCCALVLLPSATFACRESPHNLNVCRWRCAAVAARPWTWRGSLRGTACCAAAAEGLLCSPCRLAEPTFARAVAYGVYEDELREMVHLLKYERMRSLAEPLGGMLAEAVLKLRADAARELMVVAVPLFPAKERQRGYNQSVLLADAAIREAAAVAAGVAAAGAA